MPELDERFHIPNIDNDPEILAAVQVLETMIIDRCDADSDSNLSKGEVVDLPDPKPAESDL